MPLHTRFVTQMRLHTNAFTHRHFYPQNPTDPFTQRPFYTQMLLQTDALRTDTFTHRPFYTQRLDTTFTHMLLHTEGCAGRLKIAILPQFLLMEHHFVRKGCAGSFKIAILPQFLPIEPHFVQKGCRRGC